MIQYRDFDIDGVQHRAIEGQALAQRGQGPGFAESAC